MVPPQRFYPTSSGFHPSGGSSAHLFTHRCAPDPERHTPVRQFPPDSLTSRGGRKAPSGPGPGRGPRVAAVSAATASATTPATTAATSATATAAATSAATGGVTAVVAAVAAVMPAVMPARRGPATDIARPGPPARVAPATAATPPSAVRVRGPAGPAGPATAPSPVHQPVPAPAPPCPADHGPENQDRDHRQDDAETHGVTLLPFPRSGPPWAPRHPRDPHAVQRAREMPGTPAAQSGVEQLLRVCRDERPPPPKLLRHTMPPGSAVKIMASRPPRPLRHVPGRATSTGLQASMCARRASTTEPGNGTW